MNAIIYIILGLVLLLVVVQVALLYFEFPFHINRPKKHEQFYNKKIVELGNQVMRSVEKGKIKKQVLSDDTPLYDSNNALKQYVSFVEQSAIYKKIVSIEDGRFYG